MDFSSFIIYLGREIPIVVSFALIYWLVSSKHASHMLFLLLSSMILSAALKCFFKFPLKPHLADRNWYAFPSGFMQMVTVFYGYLFWIYRKKVRLVWAFIPFLLIYGWALVRSDYLDSRDVLGGGFFGLTLLAAYIWLISQRRIDKQWRLMGMYLLPFTAPLLIYSICVAPRELMHVWQAQGGLLGLSGGLLMCRRLDWQDVWSLKKRMFGVLITVFGFYALWVLNANVLKGMGYPYFPAISFFVLGVWLGGLHLYVAQGLMGRFQKH